MGDAARGEGERLRADEGPAPPEGVEPGAAGLAAGQGRPGPTGRHPRRQESPELRDEDPAQRAGSAGGGSRGPPDRGAQGTT